MPGRVVGCHACVITGMLGWRREEHAYAYIGMAPGTGKPISSQVNPSGRILVLGPFFALGDIANLLAGFIAGAIFAFGGWAAGEFVAGAVGIVRTFGVSKLAIGCDAAATVEANDVGVNFAAAAFAVGAFGGADADSAPAGCATAGFPIAGGSAGIV